MGLNSEFSETQGLGKEEDKCIEDRFIPISLAIPTPLYRPTKKHPRALFWEIVGSEKVAVSESLVCARGDYNGRQKVGGSFIDFRKRWRRRKVFYQISQKGAER